MNIAVVTGATGGIGRWIALGLARAGYHVVLVGRSRTRGQETLAWIASRIPGASLELLITDLSLLAATREAGRLIGGRYPEIKLLVNNAGVFNTRREMTEEGYDRVLATNHLAPFVLTQALLPALRAGAPARIINVGSSTSDRARIDPNDLELRRRWTMMRAYSQSKLALMMTTFAYAKRLQGSGVVANVVHPGMVGSELVRDPGMVGAAWRSIATLLLTEEQGADTPLHAALAQQFTQASGVYFKKRRIARPNRRALDPALVAGVWDATERLVNRA